MEWSLSQVFRFSRRNGGRFSIIPHHRTGRQTRRRDNDRNVAYMNNLHRWIRVTAVPLSALRTRIENSWWKKMERHGTLGAMIQCWRINLFGGGSCRSWRCWRRRYDIHHGQRPWHIATAQPRQLWHWPGSFHRICSRAVYRLWDTTTEEDHRRSNDTRSSWM